MRNAKCFIPAPLRDREEVKRYKVQLEKGHYCFGIFFAELNSLEEKGSERLRQHKNSRKALISSDDLAIQSSIKLSINHP